MESAKILEAVTGANPQGRYKTTVGMFVEEPTDGEENKLLDEFFVEKPIVQISEFLDLADNEVYSIEFLYKSRKDEDMKQQWRFLDDFMVRRNKALEGGGSEPVLVLSLVPISLRGKYSILAGPAIPQSITRTEYAADNTCTVRVLFFKEDVKFYSHDANLVDLKAIESEVVREIEDELDAEYGSR